MPLDAVATMAAARLYIAQKTPYLAMASVKLIPIPRKGLGTMGVTKNWLLLYDPDKVVEWGVKVTAGVLVHEMNHPLRHHHVRAIGADPKLANIAADMPINVDVVAMGYELPAGCVFPKTFGFPDGLTKEEYLARLNALPPEQGGSGGVGDGEDGDEGKGRGKGDPGDKGQQGGRGGGKTPGQVGACNGWCGSGAGNPLPDEPDATQEQGRSEAEGEAIAKATAEAVREWEKQHGRGSMPAGMMRWADEVLKPPKIRWQDKLARICRNAVAYRPGAGEVNYSQYSRRQSGLGYGVGRAILPAFRQKVPRVDMLIDTSGSMGTEQLNAAIAECDGILKQCGARVRLICCDADVGTFEFVRSAKEILSKLTGGGGTNFCPAFQRIDESGDRPEVLIVLTDGDATVPTLPPVDMNVIWVIIDGTRAPADWGERIDINSGGAE